MSQCQHSTLSRADFGRWAEAYALKHLQSHGLRCLEQNYRCRLGEIDLICRDDKTLVFVEVRARRHATFCHPVETIDQRKQTKLMNTAQTYQQSCTRSSPCRFDIITILAPPERPIQIDWIKHAFEVYSDTWT